MKEITINSDNAERFKFSFLDDSFIVIFKTPQPILEEGEACTVYTKEEELYSGVVELSGEYYLKLVIKERASFTSHNISNPK